jgi:dihydroorotate dehydrogenase (fumarate)
MKYGPAERLHAVKRMEGVEVKVDRDICAGCGKCFKVCIYDALKMEDNKAMIAQDYCKGCGRCEMICPNGAISITFEGYDRIEEFIARFESRVDIT